MLGLLKRNNVQAVVVVVPQGPAIRGAYPKDALDRFMVDQVEVEMTFPDPVVVVLHPQEGLDDLARLAQRRTVGPGQTLPVLVPDA